jgi:hypothetical protein
MKFDTQMVRKPQINNYKNSVYMILLILNYGLQTEDWVDFLVDEMAEGEIQ